MEQPDAATATSYVEGYPALRHLAANLPDPRAIRTFAQHACRLAALPRVTAQQIWELSKHCLARE